MEPSTSNGGDTPEGKPTAYPTAKLLKDVEKSKYINEKTYRSHKLQI